MKPRRIRRAAAVVLVAALGLVGGGLAVAPAASAAGTLGSLNFTPATGTDLTPINYATVSSGATPGCPAGATNVRGVVTGPGGWAAGIAILSNTTVGVSNTADFGGPLADTFSGIATANGLTVLAGTYTVSIICQNRLGTTTFGNFASDITFTTPTAFTSTTVATGTATSTVVTAAPPSPQATGTAVAFTATVTPAATGTVQFQDGTTPLGTPQTVTAGAATLTTSTLAVGTHSISAVFSPTAGNGFAGSTSPAISYVITGAPPTPTTTTLAAPATVVAFTPATFTVTTSPATTSGTVTLTEAGATLGSGTVTNGTGTVIVVFAVAGSHSVVANFAPAGNFSPSSSQPVTVLVGASTGVSTSETIETTVAAGSLTISVTPNPTVILPTPVLNTAGNLLTTSGRINAVTVTDTRAGAPGFTVSGVVTDFSDGALTNPHLINGFNLGWTPNVIDAAGVTVTAGAAVLPAPGLAAGATPTDPTQGLKSLRTLATAAAGGLGTTHLSAALALTAPTSTTAGTYDATLTLTAI